MACEKRARCWKQYQRKATRGLGGGAVGRVGRRIVVIPKDKVAVAP